MGSWLLLLTTWLNSWESISQPANFAHLPILPFSVLPLVKGHFPMLRRQSGTLSLMKSVHQIPSHPPNHHLKLIFFNSPTDCVGRGGRGQTVRERERELVVYRKVWEFFFSSTHLVSCHWPCAPKEKWHRKEHIIIIIIIRLKPASWVFLVLFCAKVTRPFLCSVYVSRCSCTLGSPVLCQSFFFSCISPLVNSGSAGMLSTPADFPFFSDCTAASTSLRRMGWSSSVSVWVQFSTDGSQLAL